MKFLKRAANTILSMVIIALILILLGNVWQAIQRDYGNNPVATVFGYAVFPVASGSMSGAVEVGDLILVHDTDDYAESDVITFYTEGGSYVTHRITEVSETDAGVFYTTKGDANNAEDSEPVSDEDIVGEVIYVIPHVGDVITYMHTTGGMICTALLVVMLVALVTVAGFTKKDSKDNKSNDG